MDYSPDITPDFLTVLLRASPYIILFIILPFITLIVILKYSLKKLKPISYYNDSIKVTSNPISYEWEDRNVNKVIPTSVLEELSFVSTQCPDCLKYYSCPQIY